MLYFYFFSVKKMSPKCVPDAMGSAHYKYTRMSSESLTGSLRESVSLTLKEVSLQMENDEERRRIYALLTCVVTVIFDIFLGSAAFVCAAITDSSAGYAFALDCLLDIVAASFVIWRFYGSTNICYSDFKEKVACLCLGLLFCLAAVGIVSKSVYDLVVQNAPQQLMYVFILASVGGIMNTVLGIVKYLLGKKMKSKSLILEAMNTSLSAVLALMLAVSDIVYFYYQDAWSIDPITSLIVALILFIGGIRVLCTRKHSEETTPLLAAGAV